MGNNAARFLMRPRAPTPAEVEAAAAWQELMPGTLEFDLGLRGAAELREAPEWSGTDGGGLREAIARWLDQEI